MGRDNAVDPLPIAIKFDGLSMTPEDPTVEVKVKVMGGEWSMIAMGNMAAEHSCNCVIVLKR